MKRKLRSGPLRRLVHLHRDESGNVTIEFVILFPVMIILFLSAFEIGLLMIRQVMLDRATDTAVRTLRLGGWANPSHEDLKSFICDKARILPNCRENMLIELSPVSKSDWALLPPGPTCVDKTAEIQPVVQELKPGARNEMMMVRVCALLKPLAPLSGLGMHLPRQDPDHYALVSLSAFVNEPD